MEKQYNPEIDTTKIVNITESAFTWHINKQPIKLEAGESAVKPIYVAQIGALHMVNKLLQEKYGIKYTNPFSGQNEELRKSLFAQILPEMAEERNIKPLSEEEFRTAVTKQIEEQNKLISAFQEKASENEDLKKLKQEITMLKARLAKGEKKEKVETQT